MKEDDLISITRLDDDCHTASKCICSDCQRLVLVNIHYPFHPQVKLELASEASRPTKSKMVEWLDLYVEIESQPVFHPNLKKASALMKRSAYPTRRWLEQVRSFCSGRTSRIMHVWRMQARHTGYVVEALGREIKIMADNNFSKQEIKMCWRNHRRTNHLSKIAVRIVDGK